LAFHLGDVVVPVLTAERGAAGEAQAGGGLDLPELTTASRMGLVVSAGALSRMGGQGLRLRWSGMVIPPVGDSGPGRAAPAGGSCCWRSTSAT
ncbi:hypothetical protein CTI14_53095, partial [Methylobacterium radiotolerans]